MTNKIVCFDGGTVMWMDDLDRPEGATTGVVERAILRPNEFVLDLKDGNDRIHVTLRRSGVKMAGWFERNGVKQREKVAVETFNSYDDGTAGLGGSWGSASWFCRFTHGREIELAG